MMTITDLDKSYRNFHRSQGKILWPESFLHLTTFIRYCTNIKGKHYLTQTLVDEWCAKRPTETPYSCDKRRGSIRQFLKYTNTSGYTSLSRPGLMHIAKFRQVISMTDLPLAKSVISDMLEKYIFYLKALKSSICGTTHKNLIRFNNYCAKFYPEALLLTDEMVRGWCDRRPAEQCKSRNTRVLSVRTFLKYATRHGWTSVTIPERLPNDKKSPRQPHGFTDDELNAFFKAISSIEMVGWQNELKFKLRKIQIPVYFRLLYSTGMRTNEARMLRCEDVDLTSGTLSIIQSKGFDQHRVALHPTMWKLLKLYDNAMENLMPGRKVFFPNEIGDFHSIMWQASVFRSIWAKISKEDARPYDFRSHYAVTNINSWDYDGTDWFDKLLYLSRSMGHKMIESTCYYYQLAPMFPRMLEELSGPGLRDLLPNLTEFYEDEETD